MTKKPKIAANRLNPIDSSRALRRLRCLRAEIDQIYWDTFIELLGLQPDPRNARVATSQPAEPKGESA